jgi:hypothetical protein
MHPCILLCISGDVFMMKMYLLQGKCIKGIRDKTNEKPFFFELIQWCYQNGPLYPFIKKKEYRDLFKVCLQHGLDLQETDIYGNTIMEYMKHTLKLCKKDMEHFDIMLKENDKLMYVYVWKEEDRIRCKNLLKENGFLID